MTATLWSASAGDAGDFCDGVYTRLLDALEGRGAEPSTECELTIVLTWDAAGLISNGGFEYLFESQFFDRDPGFQHTLAAFERLGAEACHRALTDAIACFPGATPPSDGVARSSLFARTPEDERWRLKRLFWSGKPAFYEALATYIGANQDQLSTSLRAD